jgi:hypothetical protein
MNKLSIGERIYRVLAALFFIGVGIYALVVHDWHWFGTFRNPQGIHLFGWPKDLMGFAAFSAAVSLVLPVASHYHEANGRLYRFFARVFFVSGWILFGASFITFTQQYSQR